MTEYCAPSSAIFVTSLESRRWRSRSASGPLVSISPMCETSKIPARSRTAVCSARMPAGYWTGISQPAKGTSRAPAATWRSCNGVRLSVSAPAAIGAPTLPAATLTAGRCSCGRMRRRAVIWTALAAALGAALVGAGSARAGTYQVLACNAPGGGGVHSSWRLVYSGGASAADFNPDPTGRCAGSDGAQLHTTSNPLNVPRGARAAWTFRAPAGDVVTHVTVWRFGQARAGWAVAARAGGHVVERCQGTGSAFCTLGASGFSLNSRKDFAIPSQPVVYWGLECAGSPPCPTGTGGKPNARLDLQGARVTVS